MIQKSGKNLKTRIDQQTPVVEAAGGLLWRETPAGRELAIIHRARYNDWTLPKGKREPGETWQETAIREVCEETGYLAQLESFAGVTAYALQDSPKVVLFWHMAVSIDHGFSSNAEVDDLIWLPLQKAREKLTYPNERALLT